MILRRGPAPVLSNGRASVPDRRGRDGSRRALVRRMGNVIGALGSSSARRSPARLEQAVNRGRVLVAGDGRTLRSELVLALRDLGFEVSEFVEWPQLVQTLRRAPPFRVAGEPVDVVVLDLRRSGLAILDRVAAVLPRGTPLVLVASSGIDLDRRRASWTVLEEPVDIWLLREAIIVASQAARAG